MHTKPLTSQVQKVRISDLIRGPKRSTLTDLQVERIAKFHEVFLEVFPGTLEAALDNFEHDADPEREILIWEEFVEQWKLRSHKCKTLQQRKKLFGDILSKAPPVIVERLKN